MRLATCKPPTLWTLAFKWLIPASRWTTSPTACLRRSQLPRTFSAVWSLPLVRLWLVSPALA
uniref:Uncharacterized protein n=1 Tax=uncultured marine virus TaxID=186617 RepID=A0A0F7KZY4_9VIRU|nr:hypothetical protein [uncultured marine virus]